MIKRLTESRAWMLAMGVVAILALAALSAALPNLRFRQPGAFVVEQGKPILLAPPAALAERAVGIDRLVIILVVLGLVAFLIALFDKKARKLIFRLLFYGALFVIVSNFLPYREEEPVAEVTAVPASSGFLAQSATAPPYADPQVSPLASYLVALTLVLVVAGLAWTLWRRSRPPSTGRLSLPGLRRIALGTLDELASGQDWRDAVIRCYARMTEAVASQRGLTRRPSMTPAEFAGRLAEAGLPPDSVQRLTHLFEAARYGGKTSSRADADEATACLNEIVAAGGAGA